MTHDPWSLHSELSCPSCHVVGKVVRFEREDGGYDCCDDEHLDDVDPYTCCECGQTWADTGQVGDVKEYRVEYMRLVEGRPYEAPKPKEPVKSKLAETFKAYDSVLKDYYMKRDTSALDEKIREVAAETYRPPPAVDFSKLKKSAHTWATPSPIEGWHRPAGKPYSADEFTFHGPLRVPVPPELVVPEPPKDAVPGTYRVTKVCQATGTVTVEYEKK